jgi:hypothetical protein
VRDIKTALFLFNFPTYIFIFGAKLSAAAIASSAAPASSLLSRSAFFIYLNFAKSFYRIFLPLAETTGSRFCH